MVSSSSTMVNPLLSNPIATMVNPPLSNPILEKLTKANHAVWKAQIQAVLREAHALKDI
jgi:hypothetical protein